MFCVVIPPIIRSAYNCIYRSGICHTVTSICRYRGRVGTGLSVLWVAYATHSTLKPVPNKMCNAASCWIYVGILLAHPILHISRIRVKFRFQADNNRNYLVTEKKCTLFLLNKSLPSSVLVQKFRTTHMIVDVGVKARSTMISLEFRPEPHFLYSSV
jgi:hypothetical protein